MFNCKALVLLTKKENSIQKEVLGMLSEHPNVKMQCKTAL